MNREPNWKARVVDRSVERAAASPGDRRSRESIARRALRPTMDMVQAASELALERGSSSFTVQDVLVRADASLQTFYRHFQSKDDLLLAVIEERVAESCAGWRKKAMRLQDPVARLEMIVKGPFGPGRKLQLSPMIVREHLRLMEDRAREIRAADDPYLELVQETIEAAQAAGHFPGLDAAEESELIMALVLSRYHNFMLGVVPRSAAKEAAHVWAFCLAALRRMEAPDEATRKPRRVR